MKKVRVYRIVTIVISFIQDQLLQFKKKKKSNSVENSAYAINNL